MKHIRDYRCSWCSKAFETPQAVKAHEKRKHSRNMPVSDEEYQRLSLERLDRERKGLSTRRLSPKYKFG